MSFGVLFNTKLASMIIDPSIFFGGRTCLTIIPKIPLTYSEDIRLLPVKREIILHFFWIEGGITGRGCSTKDKVYYKECETNSYGEGTEKFCYCNFYLCNSGRSLWSSGHLFTILITVILVVIFNINVNIIQFRYFEASVDFGVIDRIIIVQCPMKA